MSVSSVPHRRHLTVLPTTSAGWVAVGLAVAGIVLETLWTVLPFGGWAGLIVGLAGGAVALIAIRRDRAVTVFLALLPMVGAVAMIVAEVAGLG